MASLMRGTSSGQGLRTVKVDEVKVDEVSTSAVAVSAAAPSTASCNRFGALDGARLLASVHIVLGHGYQQGAFRGVYFFAWGYTWVPWFFMLSGFVLTHARLHSKVPGKVEKLLPTLRKRTPASSKLLHCPAWSRRADLEARWDRSHLCPLLLGRPSGVESGGRAVKSKIRKLKLRNEVPALPKPPRRPSS